jgi:hypothetical protein
LVGANGRSPSAGIALSAKQRFQYPNNPEIQAAWNNLLKVLGQESVAQEEFVGSAFNSGVIYSEGNRKILTKLFSEFSPKLLLETRNFASLQV